MAQLDCTTTYEQQNKAFRCLICQHSATTSPCDACDGCKTRMFEEYLAVQGGF